MTPEQIQGRVNETISKRAREIVHLAIAGIEKSLLKGHIFLSECSYSMALAKYTHLKIQEHKAKRTYKDDVSSLNRYCLSTYRLHTLQSEIKYWKWIKDGLKAQG